nr:MAG TPA: hypothetical protein [Caudoviricetes sp.]
MMPQYTMQSNTIILYEIRLHKTQLWVKEKYQIPLYKIQTIDNITV